MENFKSEHIVHIGHNSNITDVFCYATVKAKKGEGVNFFKENISDPGILICRPTESYQWFGPSYLLTSGIQHQSNVILFYQNKRCKTQEEAEKIYNDFIENLESEFISINNNKFFEKYEKTKSM